MSLAIYSSSYLSQPMPIMRLIFPVVLLVSSQFGQVEAMPPSSHDYPLLSVRQLECVYQCIQKVGVSQTSWLELAACFTQCNVHYIGIAMSYLNPFGKGDSSPTPPPTGGI